ncbi:MAG: glycosyltransferase family 4 protein [Pseudomonadota bacterium]
MIRRQAAFAIPGDINTVTGGYIYERRLLEELRALGHDVLHVELGGSFPQPTRQDMSHAVEALMALPPDRALILDGLVYGSIDTAGLAKVRAPIVAMIHHPLALETGLDSDERDHLYKTERDNLALAQQVLVPSPHTAEILHRDYGVPQSRITVVRPGLDRTAGAGVQPNAKRNGGEGVPLILSVGIQHPRKGHDILLKALHEVRWLEWQAVLVGSAHDPAHASHLKNMVADLSLSDRLTLAGKIPRKALDKLFETASLFALATRYEGYGMVFDEALAWGLPIVSCATGAVPRTIPANAGLLVPPDDPTAFAEALNAILTDGALRDRLGAASQEAGKSLPSWQDAAKTAGAVLDQLPKSGGH